jgi:hypothetical protein
VVSEALANAIKHSRAAAIVVTSEPTAMRCAPQRDIINVALQVTGSTRPHA